MNKKVVLLILDGWGIAPDPKVSAIDQARTPFMHSLLERYPHAQLNTSGLAVGLPPGQMGNSEVGHMNIGAGRVVYQDLVKVNKAVEEHTLDREPVLVEALEYAKTNGKKVHFIGLVSDGGVHSHINHVKGLCSIAHDYGLTDVFVHAFLDGRDTDPKSGLGFLEELQSHLAASTGKIATVTGRYYAMDRDKRWGRVKQAYYAMVQGVGTNVQDPLEGLRKSYEIGVTDEFVRPIIVTDKDEKPVGLIENGDVVLCFNFRTDRGREITQVLTQEDFPDFQMKKLNLHYVTMTNYDDTFQNVRVIFDKDNLNNTLGEVLSKAGKKQIRIAETEKYPHVTFFFSGGREEPFPGEQRIMCPSPKVATYDLQPEMSAFDIRDAIVKELQKKETDFVCLNFANADMVGHTGVFEAAVKVVTTALANGYTCIVIADHGNSDCMVNPDGTPNTAHTTNPVPLILVDNNYEGNIKSGKLGDLAPTILTLMGVSIPVEMTGEILVEK
ncbi:MAG: 2,3-bisphosphoglycerate-independent phosphoglycerate mutase [Cytophagales bacterium]|nr:2,3-bisphosphoglycerate-independent phosphoglycerate mutase [Cytophagales bacterium]